MFQLRKRSILLVVSFMSIAFLLCRRILLVVSFMSRLMLLRLEYTVIVMSYMWATHYKIVPKGRDVCNGKNMSDPRFEN